MLLSLPSNTSAPKMEGIAMDVGGRKKDFRPVLSLSLIAVSIKPE